jgi:hypothetical protein
MALTFAQIQAMAAEMVQMDLDMMLAASPENPSNADWLPVINMALRFISRRILLFSDSVALSLTAGTFRYNLRDTTTPIVALRVLQPVSVCINGLVLRDRFSRGPGFWSFYELQSQFPAYATAPNGTPTAAVWLGNNDGGNLILYPPPSSGIAGDANSVAGLILPADCSLSGGNFPATVPGIPEECHESVAALAAVYASLPGLTEQEAWQRVQGYSRYGEAVEQVRSVNLAALRSLTGSSNLAPMFMEAEAASEGVDPQRPPQD